MHFYDCDFCRDVVMSAVLICKWTLSHCDDDDDDDTGHGYKQTMMKDI